MKQISLLACTAILMTGCCMTRAPQDFQKPVVVYNESLTPLLHAVSNGHVDTVRFLLEGPADINAVDNDGQTA